MDYLSIINKYYQSITPLEDQGELYHILMVHSRRVADKALQICDAHPELGADRQFVEEAAMLHDIGIFRTDAPGIHCHGDRPYICHCTIGAEILRAEGFPRHALVCERHTGAGISLRQIEERNLPIPHREMLPVSIEEQIVCFADKFFSKTRLDEEKTIAQAERSLLKFGEDGVERFREWCGRFLTERN